jgi:HEPN domain-containing protein
MKKNYTKIFIGKANDDLESAIYLNNNKKHLKDIISFHCQQAIEKYLKAYLIFRDASVHSNHGLIVLLEDCVQQDSAFELIRNDFFYFLDDIGMSIRYDSDIEISEKDVDEFLILAGKTRDLVAGKTQ